MVKNQLDVLVRVHKVGIPIQCTQDSEGTFLILYIIHVVYCYKSKVELETLPQESKRVVLEFGMKVKRHCLQDRSVRNFCAHLNRSQPPGAEAGTYYM
jgi:hypothetical protein